MTSEAIVSSIEQLQNSLNNKFEDTIHIISRSSDIRQKRSTPLVLDSSKSYKIALKYFATCNNIRNITEDNNVLTYSLNSAEKKTITIDPGAYEIKDLNDFIQQKLPGELIQVLTHNPTGKVELKLKAGVKVDFKKERAFNFILGFKKEEYSKLSNISENRANINVDRGLINIKTNLISSGMISTENNMFETKNILFSIPTFTVPSNYKIIETPAKPEYLLITSSTISEVCLQIVNENDKLYDFDGEKIVIKLHIKQV